MAPIYSKRGCLACKLRKKKCGEERPACNNCTRLKLRCSFQQVEKSLVSRSSSSRQEPAVFDPSEAIPPIKVARALPVLTFRNDTEEAMTCRFRDTVAAFYLPSCLGKFRDLSVLWQMMVDDELLRNALMASLGIAMGMTPYGGQFNCSTYARALRLLRDRVASQKQDKKDALVVRTSVSFLSTLDLLGPRRSTDIFIHWKGLLKLLSYSGSDIEEEKSLLNTNLNILVLELLAWSTSTLALFHDDVHSICILWKDARLIERLEFINSDENRISRSPLLLGEYQIHKLILEVTCLLRPRADTEIDPEKIASLKSTVYSIAFSFEERFATYAPIKEIIQSALLEIDRSIRTSLLICLTALEGDTEKARDIIDSKVAENLQRFVNFPLAPVSLVRYAWSLEILVCAIQHDDDFDRFQYRLLDFQAWLVPGTYNELQLVTNSVQRIRLRTKAGIEQRHTSNFLPVGLSLLSRPYGVLSEAWD